MDELDMLRDVLTKPEPSSAAVSRGRHELQQLISGKRRVRARRPGWRIAGLGLTAAAAAGAVAAAVVMSPGTRTGAPPQPRRTAALPQRPAPSGQPAQSVQQVLLTAAASAQRAPAGAGTYWYVRTWAAFNDDHTLMLLETWTTRDGQWWIRDSKSHGQPVKMAPNVLGPFMLGGQELTFSQLQNLPADPAALTRWIVTNAEQHGSKSGGPLTDKAQERADIFASLTSLLCTLPDPPQVRATAFRALAALPGVTSLGAVHAGQRATLIVNPATGQIIGTNYIVTNEGDEMLQTVPNATVTGQWTNTLP
jgi:hypothetical protein